MFGNQFKAIKIYIWKPNKHKAIKNLNPHEVFYSKQINIYAEQLNILTN